MSEEKSVSGGSLFHMLMTRSQNKVVRILRLFDFLNNLYLWPLVFVTVESIYLSKKSRLWRRRCRSTTRAPNNV